MAETTSDAAAELWQSAIAGDARARDRLLALHYGEIRMIARKVLREDAVKLQLDPTDLAHEAAIRMMKLSNIAWNDRVHFLAMSARIMRQALMDEVRRFKSAKRSQPEIFTHWHSLDEKRALPLDQFDDALCRLATIDPARARVVELRFYAGLTLEEIAASLEQSVSTVKRSWRSARAWLLAALDENEA